MIRMIYCISLLLILNINHILLWLILWFIWIRGWIASLSWLYYFLFFIILYFTLSVIFYSKKLLIVMLKLIIWRIELIWFGRIFNNRFNYWYILFFWLYRYFSRTKINIEKSINIIRSYFLINLIACLNYFILLITRLLIFILFFLHYFIISIDIKNNRLFTLIYPLIKIPVINAWSNNLFIFAVS